MSGKLDITQNLVVSACNVIRQYCIQQEGCPGCALHETCAKCFAPTPDLWPEIKED